MSCVKIPQRERPSEVLATKFVLPSNRKAKASPAEQEGLPIITFTARPFTCFRFTIKRNRKTSPTRELTNCYLGLRKKSSRLHRAGGCVRSYLRCSTYNACVLAADRTPNYSSFRYTAGLTYFHLVWLRSSVSEWPINR